MQNEPITTIKLILRIGLYLQASYEMRALHRHVNDPDDADHDMSFSCYFSSIVILHHTPQLLVLAHVNIKCHSSTT